MTSSQENKVVVAPVEDDADFLEYLRVTTFLIGWRISRLILEPIAPYPFMVPVLYEITRASPGSLPFAAVTEFLLRSEITDGARNESVTFVAFLYYTYITPGLTIFTLFKLRQLLLPRFSAYAKKYDDKTDVSPTLLAMGILPK